MPDSFCELSFYPYCATSRRQLVAQGVDQFFSCEIKVNGSEVVIGRCAIHDERFDRQGTSNRARCDDSHACLAPDGVSY
jgi:hypothetical protein